ncbi:uncharacterized protein NECHADRAFT_82925 [Fusarium vanettenii 77-13-4]|uniref:Uncharacterized protein n=1 Tax=Fusarium vanettenii (strain ATCC MYA-4622 / CBS 123669 / FGSC 9596 / NRRL 45880 / 77-13-4) TaxID=660122 RepID=C7YX83_FUSV7|nr:uncharacterized protein NECHADRAFT_82925 [Fusarium vanettenii 77-13-4]EEU43784.1 predicted protein [Fusarium vanettenii 77-13-4]
MPDELQHSEVPIEDSPRSSMTLKTTLEDGTTINLTVSPIPTASSAVTASTTFTHTSFSFQISTSLPNQVLPLRKASPSPEAHSCPISSPVKKHSKSTSANPPPGKPSKSSNMPFELPNDVVGIDSGEKSLLFYVYADPKGNYQLSYLESPNAYGTGSYTVKKIKRAKDPWEANEDDQMIDIKVSPNNKQVAAITWKGNRGVEIRVYYVDKETEYLREVCKTGNGGWYIGALSYDDDKSNKYKIRPGTSISASVHEYGTNNYNLRVFAAEDGEVNKKGLPQISVFKFTHDESESASTWQGVYITNTVTEY